MCGIFGYVDPDGRFDPDATAERFATLLRHRGPDSFGHHFADGVLVGMVRLAIVDVAGGDQPFVSDDGECAAVVNGEIYNADELRAELAADGVAFRTRSDCEVVLPLYRRHGPAFIDRLEGMYAIAIHDRRRGELSLYRDRYGKKPIYYRTDGVFAFSSEIKGLVHLADRRPELNLRSVSRFLAYRYVLGEETIYEGIRKLPQGAFLRYDLATGRPQVETYWRPAFCEVAYHDDAFVADRLRDLLRAAVRKRLASDVPIGVLLSGGLDSSAIVALMAELTGQPVRTFTLGYTDDFPGKKADFEAARRVARHFGCDHTEHVMSSDELVADLPSVLGAFDEPFGMALSTFFVCKAVRQAGIKVLMNGDGADEYFGSYRAHRLALPIHNYLALQSAGVPLDDHTRRALAPYEHNVDEVAALAAPGAAWRVRLFPYDRDELSDLLSGDAAAALGRFDPLAEYAATYLAGHSTADPLNRILETEINTFLADNLLYLADRLAMAHSIEMRSPYLDLEFTRFAATLPGALRMHGGVSKHILKRALAPLLPADIVHRPKEGFILPTNEWLMGKMQDTVREALAPGRLAGHGLFSIGAVQRYLAEHYAGRVNHGYRLWSLLVFQIWWESSRQHETALPRAERSAVTV